MKQTEQSKSSIKPESVRSQGRERSHPTEAPRSERSPGDSGNRLPSRSDQGSGSGKDITSTEHLLRLRLKEHLGDPEANKIPDGTGKSTAVQAWHHNPLLGSSRQSHHKVSMENPPGRHGVEGGRARAVWVREGKALPSKAGSQFENSSSSNQISLRFGDTS